MYIVYALCLFFLLIAHSLWSAHVELTCRFCSYRLYYTWNDTLKMCVTNPPGLHWWAMSGKILDFYTLRGSLTWIIRLCGLCRNLSGKLSIYPAIPSGVPTSLFAAWLGGTQLFNVGYQPTSCENVINICNGHTNRIRYFPTFWLCGFSPGIKKFGNYDDVSLEILMLILCWISLLLQVARIA